MPYPYADIRGIVPSTVPNPNGVITAVDGVDNALEDMRIGDLLFQKLRLELNPVPLVPNSSGVITISGSYHLVRTAKVSQQIFTINGTNQGDVLVIERASNSGHLVIGEFLLHEAGAHALVMALSSGFAVLECTGKRITPAFKAYRPTAYQSINPTTDTVVQFSATMFNQIAFPSADDLAGCFAVDAYTYSPGRDGLYDHRIVINWASAITAGVNCYIYLQKNSVTIADARFQGNGAANFVMTARFLDYANTAAPVYRVLVRQNDGAARNLDFGYEKTWWTATRLGAY